MSILKMTEEQLRAIIVRVYGIPKSDQVIEAAKEASQSNYLEWNKVTEGRSEWEMVAAYITIACPEKSKAEIDAIVKGISGK